MATKKPEPPKGPTTDKAPGELHKSMEAVQGELDDAIGTLVVLDVALQGDLEDTAHDNLPQVLLTLRDLVSDARDHVQSALGIAYGAL